MPLTWQIDHKARLVTMTADGEVTLKDGEAYLDAVVVADAMPYAKLVDLTKMETHVSDDDMMALGARISAYGSTMQAGPLCLVVTRPAILDYARRYINLGQADRPVNICKTVAEATAWLATVQG